MNPTPHPDCDMARAQLDAYLSRELPEEAAREVRRHLENCPQCAAELAARATLRAQLQAAVRASTVRRVWMPESGARCAATDRSVHAPACGPWSRRPP